MERIVSISEAAEVLGVSITTLRRWEAAGKLVAEHTAGGHRRYDLAKLRPELFRTADQGQRRTVAYVRVASPDHKDDLERQQLLLQRYCARQGWTFEVIADRGFADRNFCALLPCCAVRVQTKLRRALSRRGVSITEVSYRASALLFE